MSTYKKMSGAWLRGTVATYLVMAGMTDVVAETLLIARPETDTLEFVDPGSGLRLASVTVGNGPRRVSVAPDGKRAAIANCRTATRPVPATGATNGAAAITAAGATDAADAAAMSDPVTLSIVDLENPKELHRTALALESCPTGLTWFAADRIAVTTPGEQGFIAVETYSGRTLGPLSAADREVLGGLRETLQAADPESIAVQQFMAAGGQLDQLAVAPVLPRAICHACTPEP